MDPSAAIYRTPDCSVGSILLSKRGGRGNLAPWRCHFYFLKRHLELPASFQNLKQQDNAWLRDQNRLEVGGECNIFSTCWGRNLFSGRSIFSSIISSHLLLVWMSWFDQTFLSDPRKSFFFFSWSYHQIVVWIFKEDKLKPNPNYLGQGGNKSVKLSDVKGFCLFWKSFQLFLVGISECDPNLFIVFKGVSPKGPHE